MTREQVSTHYPHALSLIHNPSTFPAAKWWITYWPSCALHGTLVLYPPTILDPFSLLVPRGRFHYAIIIHLRNLSTQHAALSSHRGRRRSCCLTLDACNQTSWLSDHKTITPSGCMVISALGSWVWLSGNRCGFGHVPDASAHCWCAILCRLGTHDP